MVLLIIKILEIMEKYILPGIVLSGTIDAIPDWIAECATLEFHTFSLKFVLHNDLKLLPSCFMLRKRD